jgi:hypothetical protein
MDPTLLGNGAGLKHPHRRRAKESNSGGSHRKPRAYRVRTQEIFGPGTLDSEYFNILAKVPPGSDNAQVAVMFRNMLAERFKLTLHHENRALPAYSL